MKVLVVRVSKGEVTVEANTVSSINKGIAIFIGISNSDDSGDLVQMAEKVVNLRIFENEEGKLHYSVKDRNYQVLCIPNFTLCANTDKGRRPSFEEAMIPKDACAVFDKFVSLLKSKGVDVQAGRFGAHMQISLKFDGPVNIVLDSKPTQ